MNILYDQSMRTNSTFFWLSFANIFSCTGAIRSSVCVVSVSVRFSFFPPHSAILTSASAACNSHPVSLYVYLRKRIAGRSRCGTYLFIPLCCEDSGEKYWHLEKRAWQHAHPYALQSWTFPQINGYEHCFSWSNSILWLILNKQEIVLF